MSVEVRFDESIHAPTRLRVCAMLRPVDGAEFSAVAAALGRSEANLSKTVKKLVDLGYLSAAKQASRGRADERRITILSLTTAGRRAVDGHIAALRALLDE